MLNNLTFLKTILSFIVLLLLLFISIARFFFFFFFTLISRAGWTGDAAVVAVSDLDGGFRSLPSAASGVAAAAADLGLGQLLAKVIFCLIGVVQDPLGYATKNLLDRRTVNARSIAFDSPGVLGVASVIRVRESSGESEYFR